MSFIDCNASRKLKIVRQCIITANNYRACTCISGLPYDSRRWRIQRPIGDATANFVTDTDASLMDGQDTAAFGTARLPRAPPRRRRRLYSRHSRLKTQLAIRLAKNHPLHLPIVDLWPPRWNENGSWLFILYPWRSIIQNVLTNVKM